MLVYFSMTYVTTAVTGRSEVAGDSSEEGSREDLLEDSEAAGSLAPQARLATGAGDEGRPTTNKSDMTSLAKVRDCICVGLAGFISYWDVSALYCRIFQSGLVYVFIIVLD